MTARWAAVVVLLAWPAAGMAQDAPADATTAAPAPVTARPAVPARRVIAGAPRKPAPLPAAKQVWAAPGDKATTLAQPAPRPAVTVASGPVKAPDPNGAAAAGAAPRSAPRPAATAPPAATASPRLDLAPVPNRSLEGPTVQATPEGPVLAPAVIQGRVPGRGESAQGNPSIEDRQFNPAPGARFSVPFRY